MTPDELLKNADIERVAKEGALIYQSVKSKYEPTSTGQFLAIDIESRDQYLAPTSAEAVIKARAAHPNKVFYVVKVGFDAAETLANLIVPKK
jgi:hypothetical protein